MYITYQVFAPAGYPCSGIHSVYGSIAEAQTLASLLLQSKYSGKGYTAIIANGDTDEILRTLIVE